MFVRRLINVRFTLGEGNFGEQGQDQVDISGLRISARLTNAGGRGLGQASVRVYGLTFSKMNQLSRLGLKVTSQRLNSIALSAGDEGSTISRVYVGTIIDAYADFSSAPDVPFIIGSQAAFFEAAKPAPPISIRGSADVASIMSGLANSTGHAFENNGVTARLSNAYYAGSYRAQALAIVRDAGIMWNGFENGTLAIWPPGGARKATSVILSPETGMIGYPTYTATGLLIRSIFNPSIGLGSKIDVRSSLRNTSGTWIVNLIDHELDTIIEKGPWFSTLSVVPPGLYVA